MSSLWRCLGLAGVLFLAAPSATALMPDRLPSEGTLRLGSDQSRAVRAWMVRILEDQVRRGPTPRWTHRDCAGLVRFAVAESLVHHDARWRRSMGMAGRLPPDTLSAEQQARLRHQWRRPDGSQGAYVGALALIQENSHLVARDASQAQPGDLLFFDQGDDQHLMVWTGRRLIYHTGQSPQPGDNGLRAVTLGQLLSWRDPRWRPEPGNPNFIGVFRLAFLQ